MSRALTIAVTAVILAGCRKDDDGVVSEAPPKFIQPTQASPAPVPDQAAEIQSLRDEVARLRIHRDQLQKQLQALSPKPAAKLYTREEFKDVVWGKTQDDVLKLLGTPFRVNEEGLGGKSFNYRGLTREVITGKMDFSVTVYFRADRSGVLRVLPPNEVIFSGP